MSAKQQNDADSILADLIENIREREVWNVAETPDGHSRAWHGSWILMNARVWLAFGEIPAAGYQVYQPIYTRQGFSEGARNA